MRSQLTSILFITLTTTLGSFSAQRTEARPADNAKPDQKRSRDVNHWQTEEGVKKDHAYFTIANRCNGTVDLKVTYKSASGEFTDQPDAHKTLYPMEKDYSFKSRKARTAILEIDAVTDQDARAHDRTRVTGSRGLNSTMGARTVSTSTRIARASPFAATRPPSGVATIGVTSIAVERIRMLRQSHRNASPKTLRPMGVYRRRVNSRHPKASNARCTTTA